MRSSLKKHKWLLSAAGVLLLLLLLAVWRLFVAVGNFSAAKQNLQAVTARLGQLNNRDPFPSPENIAREKENYHELLDAYNELNDRLREGQELPRPMGDSDFIPLLENTLRRLRTGFSNSRVELPKDFTFGFAKYAGGQMPASQDIPRLVQQLQIIEKLCQAVMDARITQLMDVTREEFEAGSQPAGAGARRGRGAAPVDSPEVPPDAEQADALFHSQEFAVTLRGSEPALMEFLNELSALPIFTVVTSVELKNTRQEVRDGKSPAAPGPQPAKPAAAAPADPRERPVVIGREDVVAKIVIEVYQFAPPLAWDDAGGV